MYPALPPPPPQIHGSSVPSRITRGGAHGLTLHFKGKDGAEQALEVGTVMMATGRKPRTHALGLEAAGVQVDDGGAIKV